ncbi:BTB/POZ domain-containing protein KCTD17 [Aphelenchoides avenae]|nr:BTB/POZ domain-containing protein KCTD17 [Aphelenchus avenae]
MKRRRSDLPSSSSVENSNWVRLNVGGTVFRTTKQTLRNDPESFFAKLLDTDMEPSEKDETGAFLIDRDPACFQTILNYLRSGSVYITDRNTIPGLMKEADFYGLIGLMEQLEMESKKTKTKEYVFIEEDSPEHILIVLPTLDKEYDVYKELKSANHFPLLCSCTTRSSYHLMGVPFKVALSHVTMVTTKLGFKVKDVDEELEMAVFVRNVEQ